MLSIFKNVYFFAKRNKHSTTVMLLFFCFFHLANWVLILLKSRAIFIAESQICTGSLPDMDTLLRPFMPTPVLAITFALCAQGKPCLLCGAVLYKVIEQWSGEIILALIADEETGIMLLNNLPRSSTWLA